MCRTCGKQGSRNLSKSYELDKVCWRKELVAAATTNYGLYSGKRLADVMHGSWSLSPKKRKDGLREFCED